MDICGAVKSSGGVAWMDRMDIWRTYVDIWSQYVAICEGVELI